jgi:hypothetical protein
LNLDPTLLMLSLVPSGVGFVLFVYGKKQERWAHLAAGLALMIYPYFANTSIQILLGGLLIGCAFWWALQSGW